jgi:hypothetical protein
MLPESCNFIRFGVIQVRKIWIDSRLPIRPFAFFDERHENHNAKAYAKERQERPAYIIYNGTAIYILLRFHQGSFEPLQLPLFLCLAHVILSAPDGLAIVEDFTTRFACSEAVLVDADNGTASRAPEMALLD